MGDLVGRHAAWSPDGKSLAYCNGNNIFVAKADGTEPRMLVTMKDQAAVDDPVWSPGGKSLRFDVAETLSGHWLIWEVSLDGTACIACCLAGPIHLTANAAAGGRLTESTLSSGRVGRFGHCLEKPVLFAIDRNRSS